MSETEVPNISSLSTSVLLLIRAHFVNRVILIEASQKKNLYNFEVNFLNINIPMSLGIEQVHQ